MIVRSIDTDGDWQFGKGRNDYKRSIDAISQNIKTRLQSFLGDCFFAIQDGVDWFSLLGAKNELAIQLAVNSTILNTDGVSKIINSSVVLNSLTRRITMTYTVESVYTLNGSSVKIIGNNDFLLGQGGFTLVTEDGNPISGG